VLHKLNKPNQTITGNLAVHNYVLALTLPSAGEMLTGHQQLLLQIVMVL
jgi:hypothetical protein